MADQTGNQEGKTGKGGEQSKGQVTRRSEEGAQPREERGLWPQAGAGMSPFSFMRRFSEEMDRLFEDFGFGRSIFSPWTSTGGGKISRREFGRGIWTPPIEMFTRGDQLVVRAELPGLSKEDVKAEITDNAIMLRGERRQEKEENREGQYHSERIYGQFYREIPLPEGVSAEGAKATFKDGVLEITMKAPEKSKSRQIKIEG